MDTISIIVVVVTIVLNILIIKYLSDLETLGCKCAMDWKRKYLMMYAIFSMILIVITSVYGKKMNNMVHMIAFILMIGNIIFTLMYVNELKAEECDCSEDVMRDIMYMIAVVKAILIPVAILAMLYLASAGEGKFIENAKSMFTSKKMPKSLSKSISKRFSRSFSKSKK